MAYNNNTRSPAVARMVDPTVPVIKLTLILTLTAKQALPLKRAHYMRQNEA